MPCDTDEKHIARHESTAGIGDFIAAAAYALKKSGKMYLIHRPSRLADIICEARNNNMEPKLMQFIVPHPGQSPNLVLIQLVKNGGRELRVLPEISVRNSDGNWSEEIDVIYGRAAHGRSEQ